MKGYTLKIHPFNHSRSPFLLMAFVAVQWCDDEVQTVKRQAGFSLVENPFIKTFMIIHNKTTENRQQLKYEICICTVKNRQIY